MKNYSSTLWIDNHNTDLNSVMQLLLAPHADDISETSLCYVNWYTEKMLSDVKKAIFNGKEIEFTCIKYSFDQYSVGLEDDTVTKEGLIIPFLCNGKIRYVVTRNTGAKTMLRKLLSYTGKGEIEKSKLSFNGDMFVWIINKIYQGDNSLISESENLKDLHFDSVRGIKGDTEDYLTKVSAEGESVINIISTLSFLLESQNLNQIKLDIAYGDYSNIDITLSNKNVLSTDFDRLYGKTITDSSEEIASVFILLYMEVLPIITQSYLGEIDNNQWGQGKCVEFLKKVAKDLSDKVEKRVADLTAKPEQLKLDMSQTTDD